MADEILLGLITFFTSTIAGVVGLGGGMMLIAILPSFLPLNALIPIHGLTQMSSNFSRAIFGYKYVKIETIPKFLFGSLCGIALFASILYLISLKYVPSIYWSIYIIIFMEQKI